MDGKSLLGPFVSLNDALDPLKPAAKRFSFYASRARKFIVQETNRCCEKSLDRNNRPMVNALAELAERSRLRLMSLNYDDLPAASGIQFFTGFVADDAPYQRFVTTPAWPEDQHTWCQLHGSVLFRVKSHAEHGIVRYPNSRAAARQKWVDNADWYRYQDGHKSGLSPIITGLRKTDAILSEPFATYAHRLRVEASSCDRWLIIGYGGGDPHINHLLSQARAQWQKSGQKHRVIVVGYYEQQFATPFSTLVFQGDALDWEGVGSIWLFEEEDYDPSKERMFRPRRVSKWTDELALTLDGVDWAMGPGLSEIIKFLEI